MTSPGLRASCDNCRYQKLKCIRDHAQEKCRRCSRLNKVCKHSRTGRSGRPRRESPTSSTTATPASASSVSPLDEVMESHDSLSAPTDNDIPAPTYDTNLDFFSADEMPLAQVHSMPDLGYLAHSATDSGSARFVPTDPKLFSGLSEINNRLQSYNSRILTLEAPLKLDLFRSNESPLLLNKDVTLAESLLILGQGFLDNLIELKRVVGRQCPADNLMSQFVSTVDLGLDPRLIHSDGDESHHPDLSLNHLFPPPQVSNSRLESNTALLVVGIYIQLATIFDLMFSLVTSEMYGSAIRVDAAPAAHGLRLGAFATKDGTMQALVYTQMVIRLLAQIDRQLGLVSNHQMPNLVQINEPLLSPRHAELLHAELNEDPCLGGGGKRERLHQTMHMIRTSLEACDESDVAHQ